MYLYNSATHKKEEFVPYDPKLVKMYTCGPTVYHFAHIGNLRSYIMEDVPQGLGLLESLGAALEVPTPVCSSLIEIASAALGCDLRAQGRTIERLGRDNIRAILDDAERGADVCPDGMR